MTEPPEGPEVVVTTDKVRVEIHRLGELMDERDIAGPEWGHSNVWRQDHEAD